MVKNNTSTISVNLDPFAHVKKNYANSFIQERIAISADKILEDNFKAVSTVFNKIHSEMFKIISEAATFNKVQRDLTVKNFKKYFSALEEISKTINSRTFDLSVNNFKYFVHLDDNYDFKSVAIKNRDDKLIYQVVLEGYEDDDYQLTIVNPRQSKTITVKGHAWDDDLWWLHNPGTVPDYN